MGKPKAPSNAPVAAASQYGADLAYEAQMAQLGFSQQQYAEMKPLYDQIVNAQVGMMDQQRAMGEDSYAYQTGLFRPVEQQIVADAQKFNTDTYREQLAGDAKAATAQAFSNQDAATGRQLAAQGLSPERIAVAQKQNDIAQAAAEAGAMNSTRMQADDKGRALLAGAAGLGRGMAPSLAAYSGAMNAGNSAGQNAMMPGNQYMAGMNAAYGQGLQGAQMNLQGQTSIYGAQMDAYGQQLQANAAMTGAVLGGVAGLGGNWMEFMS